MEYTNPNEVWRQANDGLYKGMSEKERERVGCMQGMLFVGMLLAFALCLFLSSCKTTEYVAVPQQHTEHHWHTDSIHTTDSVIKEKETVVMMLDSAEMAKYGVKLKAAERAWLVKSWELERQIEALQRLTAERDTVHDSIPVPYPVEMRLTKWQQAKVDWGGWALLVLIVLVVIAIYYPRRSVGSK
mgnify:CR=1 FL=1